MQKIGFRKNIGGFPVCNSMFDEMLTFSCKKCSREKIIKIENDSTFYENMVEITWATILEEPYLLIFVLC